MRFGELSPGPWEASWYSSGLRFLIIGNPSSLHVGLDVLFEPGLAHHRIIEANAFGDLLPNLTLDGLSVYRWEIRAALSLRGR